MNIVRRIFSWLRERGKTWTAALDFPDDVVDGVMRVETVFGVVADSARCPYDRFSCVWNTQHYEMWRASWLHDMCCNQMHDHGDVIDESGKIIMESWDDVNLAFYMEMIRAISLIAARLYKEGIPPKRVAREIRRLSRRASTYYIGVQLHLKHGLM